LEGNGVGSVAATTTGHRYSNVVDRIRTFGKISAAGFRRYATYRQATLAGAFTNVIFGFLRCYVLLAVAAGSGAAQVAGYTREQLVTFVWAGQGLLSVVHLGAWTDLADRIRTGDVVADLLRPVHPVTSYLATDVGRAGHAALTRMVPPMLVGPLFFPVYLPHRWQTVPLFLLSVVLATVACFGCRYLVNATGYWLLDVRGPLIFWMVAAGVFAGLYFPIRFLPDWVAVTSWVLTPLPGLFQAPLDVLVERDGPAVQAGLVAVQAVWAALMLLACRAVQRRAERRLVVQGG
jgi:viologen exporter family transport system permease protein